MMRKYLNSRQYSIVFASISDANRDAFASHVANIRLARYEVLADAKNGPR